MQWHCSSVIQKNWRTFFWGVVDFYGRGNMNQNMKSTCKESGLNVCLFMYTASYSYIQYKYSHLHVHIHTVTHLSNIHIITNFYTYIYINIFYSFHSTYLSAFHCFLTFSVSLWGGFAKIRSGSCKAVWSPSRPWGKGGIPSAKRQKTCRGFCWGKKKQEANRFWLKNS